jgi:hypothetical protein
MGAEYLQIILCLNYNYICNILLIAMQFGGLVIRPKSALTNLPIWKWVSQFPDIGFQW